MRCCCLWFYSSTAYPVSGPDSPSAVTNITLVCLIIQNTWWLCSSNKALSHIRSWGFHYGSHNTIQHRQRSHKVMFSPWLFELLVKAPLSIQSWSHLMLVDADLKSKFFLWLRPWEEDSSCLQMTKCVEIKMLILSISLWATGRVKAMEEEKRLPWDKTLGIPALRNRSVEAGLTV